MLETTVLLAKALIATIVVEEIAALFWRERSIRFAAVVLAANVATNPALNVAIIACSDWVYATPKNELAAIAVGEAAVLIAETSIFWRWGKTTFERAALLATALNVASFCSGFALTALGYWDW